MSNQARFIRFKARQAGCLFSYVKYDGGGTRARASREPSFSRSPNVESSAEGYTRVEEDWLRRGGDFREDWPTTMNTDQTTADFFIVSNLPA